MTYRSDESEGPTAGTETVDRLEFLARVLVLIPDKGHVTMRYYGWYANCPCGMRRQMAPAAADGPPAIVPAPRLTPTEASRPWAALLQQIFEVAPLACPACHGAMRIVAFITQALVIDRILTHLRAHAALAMKSRNPGLQFVSMVAVVAVIGCATTSTVRVDEDAQDNTPASALWLQADIPGMPLQNGYLRDTTNTDSTVNVGPDPLVRLSALGTDNESGVRRLEIAGMVTTYRLTGTRWTRRLTLVGNNFGGITQVPLTTPRDVPRTARVNATIDFAAYTQQYQLVIIHLQAVAESGAPPISNQPAKTRALTRAYKQPGSPPL